MGFPAHGEHFGNSKKSLRQVASVFLPDKALSAGTGLPRRAPHHCGLFYCITRKMPDTTVTLADRKKAMEKKLHGVLLDFERETGLAVTAIQIARLDEGKVLSTTSEALNTKVELFT